MFCRFLICELAIASLVIIPGNAFAYSGEKLAKDAKVSIEQARTIARTVRPGKITDEELEKEAGGTGLRYTFDIRSNGAVYEVGVDAVTGKVLENAQEGANPD